MGTLLIRHLYKSIHAFHGMKKRGWDIDFCLAKPYMVGLEIEKDGIHWQDKISHYTCLYVQMRLPMGISAQEQELCGVSTCDVIWKTQWAHILHYLDHFKPKASFPSNIYQQKRGARQVQENTWLFCSISNRCCAK